MIDPVTITLAVTGIITIFSKVIGWLKTYAEINAPVLVPLLLVSQSNTPPAILPPQSNENMPRLEYRSSKEESDFAPSYHRNDDQSSSNASAIAPLILVFIVVLGVMALIIYRKRNRLKDNYSKYDRNDKQLDSPLSPPTTQTDHHLTIV